MASCTCDSIVSGLPLPEAIVFCHLSSSCFVISSPGLQAAPTAKPISKKANLFLLSASWLKTLEIHRCEEGSKLVPCFSEEWTPFTLSLPNHSRCFLCVMETGWSYVNSCFPSCWASLSPLPIPSPAWLLSSCKHWHFPGPAGVLSPRSTLSLEVTSISRSSDSLHAIGFHIYISGWSPYLRPQFLCLPGMCVEGHSHSRCEEQWPCLPVWFSPQQVSWKPGQHLALVFLWL